MYAQEIAVSIHIFRDMRLNSVRMFAFSRMFAFLGSSRFQHILTQRISTDAWKLLITFQIIDNNYFCFNNYQFFTALR